MPPPNFKNQNGDTREVTQSTHILHAMNKSCNEYTENIWRYSGKFSWWGNHATGICASLAYRTLCASCFSTTSFRNILCSEKYLTSYVPDGHNNGRISACKVTVCCCPNFNNKRDVQTKLSNINFCENTFSSWVVVRTDRHNEAECPCLCLFVTNAAKNRRLNSRRWIINKGFKMFA